MDNLLGIYTVGYSDLSNTIKLECLGALDKTQGPSVTDQQLSTFEISKFVHGFMYKCNITHHFLLSTKKLPVAYINVCYTKYPLKVVLLYRIFLYFNIDSVDHITKMEDFVEKPFNGKYVIEASINNKVLEIENIDEGYNNDNQLNDKMMELVKSQDMMDLLTELVEDVEEAMCIQYKDDDMFKMPDIAVKNINKGK